MTRAILLSAVLAATVSGADTLIVLDDVEGKIGPWRNTEVVPDPVHSGKRALRWNIAEHPILDSPRFLADWTEFDELRFWGYLEKPVDFKVPIVFPSEGGYYIIDWRLDWQGWKEHRILLADCRKAHDPVGWDRIRSVGFRPQGYGQGPVPEGLTLVLDDFALHSPKDLPETNLEAWIARERMERVKELKARGNPYILSVLDSLQTVKAEPSLPEKLTSAWQFSGPASNAMAMAWAAAWDDSPLKGNEALIAHASGLIDFCLEQQKDGSWFYSKKWESGDPNSDRFALGPLMDAIYWLRKLPQGEAAWPRWEAPLKELVEFQYEHWGGKTGHAWSDSATRYPNQDVFHLFEMALALEFWGDDKYRESLEATLAGLEAHLLPDGGLNYIGPETEIPCYHDLNVLWIARYYDLTGDERARELLAKTVNYYPLTYSNEARPEYYTDCWWKHYWSDGAACGPEIIAGITGDPQNKWLADRLLERVGPGSQYRAIYAGMFYRDDITAEPLPDNYIKLDRNIGGPRGRFGSWYFAATPGGGARDTFVGAMVCRSEAPEPLCGALLAANIEVGLGGDGARDRTHLYISGLDDITDSAIGDEAAAFAARYSPRKPYINSVPDREVPPTPWQATQVWLLTKDGLVGLVEIEATEEQTVPYVAGELRFGPSQPLGLREVDVTYLCGDVRMHICSRNFPETTSGPARPGYAQKSTAHSAFTLRTEGDSFTARSGEPLYYAAAIWPSDAPGWDYFTRVKTADVWGFTAVQGDRRFAVVFNPGEGPAQAEIGWPKEAGEPQVYRGQSAASEARAVDGKLALTLEPGSVALIVEAE